MQVLEQAALLWTAGLQGAQRRGLGGQRLAIESGYYDAYKSAHWLQWYHQTRAKNAITYDNGKGQVFFEQDGVMGTGGLTQRSSAADHEIVSGDATAAYGGALSKAKRSMVYLRPGLILVYDNLASATPRQWEWNIHALNMMTQASDTKISIASGGQTLCVDMLAGPAMRFTQTSSFTAAPSSGAPQWHGRFHSTQMLGATEFVALLRVGCGNVPATASKANGVWTVNVAGKTVSLGESGASVAAQSAAPGANEELHVLVELQFLVPAAQRQDVRGARDEEVVIEHLFNPQIERDPAVLDAPAGHGAQKREHRAVRLGFARASSSIIDGNVANLIICVVLYYFGTQEIRGFAITLGIGGSRAPLRTDQSPARSAPTPRATGSRWSAWRPTCSTGCGMLRSAASGTTRSSARTAPAPARSAQR